MSGAIAGRPTALEAWLAAIRPATLTAALGPVAVGTALAASDDLLALGPAAAALLGAVMIQIGTNFYNDHADHVRGADTAERLGPARAVQRGWLSSRQILTGSLVAFALATLAGAYLVAVGGLPIALLGVLSIASGIAYTGGPLPLAYVGLGDAFVMAFFGVGAVSGTYFVQAAARGLPAVPSHVLAASIAVGALATAILVVNNLRDRHTDAKARKRTLVVRFGRRFGLAEHAGLILLAYAIAPVVAWHEGRPGWLLPLVSAPLAARCVRDVARAEGAALNPLLGATARVGLAYSLLLAVGVLL